jgi:hypothetical protein
MQNRKGRPPVPDAVKETWKLGVVRGMKDARRAGRWVWGAVIFLAAIGSAVALRRIVHLVPVVIGAYRPPAAAPKPALAQLTALDDLFARYPILTLVHIVPGLFFMLLVPWQFSATIRARHVRWHRWNGRILACCGVVIGVSALVMSFGMPAIGGVNQAAATTLFGAFFLVALGKAVWHIRRKEVVLHREWMIRAFAVGLAVATIRPIIGIFLATSRISGLTPREFFGIAFWIGFTVQLMAAEAWIRWTAGERKLEIAKAGFRVES